MKIKRKNIGIIKKINMDRFDPNIHHRHSIRLRGYDYSRAGLYFITICCQGGICRFGDIIGANPGGHPKMILNEYGQIAYNEWLKTTEIRNNVELGDFVIMPNHIHGVIRLLCRGVLHTPPSHFTKLNNELHSHDNKNVFYIGENELGVCNTPLRSASQTIGAIVRGYKSSVTKQLELLGFNEKLWQRNYYEHIIRNDESYQRILEYIANNPANWEDDKFFIK